MTNEQQTGDDGKATFQLEYGDYTATITKDGYQTVTENIAFRSNHKNFNITLEEATATVSAIVYSNGNPLSNQLVMLRTNSDYVSNPVSDGTVAFCNSSADSFKPLNVTDPTTHTPTQSTDIPFGTYYLCVPILSKGQYGYIEEFVVDGDKEVTIQLQH